MSAKDGWKESLRSKHVSAQSIEKVIHAKKNPLKLVMN